MATTRHQQQQQLPNTISCTSAVGNPASVPALASSSNSRLRAASSYRDPDVVEVSLSTAGTERQLVVASELLDSDEDSDPDSDEEGDEDGAEEEEEESEQPTPTNEMTADDEFEWIRSSPILTSLLEQEQSRTGTSVGHHLPPFVGGRSSNIELQKPRHRSPATKPVPSISSASSAVPDDAGESRRRSTSATNSTTTARRREDYKVVGGELDAPSSASSSGNPPQQRSDTLSANRELSHDVGHHRCPCDNCRPQTRPSISLPPPPATSSVGGRAPSATLPSCFRNEGGCACGSYEDVTYGGGAGSRTLSSRHGSRTPQPYLSDPSPVVQAASRLRPRAHSQPRSHRRRQHQPTAHNHSRLPDRLEAGGGRGFGGGGGGGAPAQFPPMLPPHYAFGCPFNHGRNLALEYVQWMSFFKTNGLPLDYDDLQEKVHRLEEDKESLSMQVSVLGEQIEAQTDKIRDLETMLDNKKGQLESVEDMLQHGLMSLESQKLDLMAEISNLKLRLTSIEKEKLDMEDRARKAELEGISLKTQLCEKDREISAARMRPSVRHLSAEPNNHDASKTGYHVSPDNSLRRVQQRYLEMEKLRKALECVMAANDEKDRKIDELQGAVTRYKTVQDRVLSPHFRKSNSYTTEDEDGADGSPTKSSHEENGHKSRTSSIRLNDNKPPVGPRPFATSTPLHMKNDMSPEMAAPQSPHGSLTKQSPSSNRATSQDEISAIPQKTPPVQLRHLVDPHGGQYGQQHYGTIPRKTSAGGGMAGGLTPPDAYRSVHNVDLDASRSRSGRPSGLSFGKGFFRLKTGKRSCSAPNLGPGEVQIGGDDHSALGAPNSQSMEQQQQLQVATLDQKHKTKGIKRIFGRLKRSNSQHLEEPVGEFRRGGVRSTAGPRLGWSTQVNTAKERVDVPFGLWNGERIATWLHDMGLTAYIGDCKRWVKNGNQLLNATTHDLEKELGMKNSLHRKKLQLSLQALNADGDTCSALGTLDYNWVTRWLDDVGLPQYKDAFCDARIDGRVLDALTVEDLFLLKVTNMLHYISLKRGIQVLRANKFNPNCLKRRPSPDEAGKISTPADIALWTNHRVMEWLRSVDLSEYAPNLRGSGVHGAILVYEAKFNVELLASLLSIPANKTLLRRHLSTHFKQLVGADVVKQKRDYEADGFLPLNPSIRIKANRRSQFTLMKKKGKHDIDLEDYVCPLDTSFGDDAPASSANTNTTTTVANTGNKQPSDLLVAHRDRYNANRQC